MKKGFILLLRALVAIILLQTLYFKFTGAPESVYIFQSIGAEPIGRIGSGVVELMAAILILIPRTSWLGSVLAAGTMSGAILSHIFFIGLRLPLFDESGAPIMMTYESSIAGMGTLFILACVVMIASLINLWFSKEPIEKLYNSLVKKSM